LAIVGGVTTVTEALEVFPDPPFVELTDTLLSFTPDVVPVTFTDMAQDVFAVKLAPLKLTEVAPPVAVAVPPHVLLSPLGVVTTRPAGKLSVNATPVRDRAVLLFVIVKVRLVAPFSGTVEAPNAFVIDGGLVTVRVALEVD
jgi:hypothetical protein